jgi:hypothetical protein
MLGLSATTALASVEGDWDVTDHPQLSVTALGQPVKTKGLSPLPKTMQLVFQVDPGYPDTGG